jgi:hypothetical protein
MDHLTDGNVPAADGSTGGAVRRNLGRRIAIVATGSVLTLGAGGIAYAATTSPTPDGGLAPPGGRGSGGAGSALCDQAPDSSTGSGSGSSDHSSSSSDSGANDTFFQAA